ncbi:MAG: hypothetical protein PHV63_00025 [Candidatus Daviesbacteria bacterium]|nr:hypothetical protein [Candidatus Daviesbacteria bacterium]
MPSRSVEAGYQFPLPITIDITDLASQQLANKRRDRKIWLLTRILGDESNGDLYRDRVMIEANFKAGGSRTRMYFYDTKHGRRTVEATPEDIMAVLDRRHARQKAA